jgi:histidinol-phosphate phosphatase family protein
MNFRGLFYTKEWTLFLDRDGVISQRKPHDYVRTWEEFRFLDGVLEAMSIFDKIFGRIIIVSNQQGVGKGIMSAEDLQMIDLRMKNEISSHGGRIDASFYCTHLDSEYHPDRKPNTGMGLKARSNFPEIDFSKSVMVGDSPSDMEFGKRLGMANVFINENDDKHELADYQYSSLKDFALSIQNLVG